MAVGLGELRCKPQEEFGIKFPSHPAFQLGPNGPRIFVNLPKVNLPKSFEIDVIDWSRNEVVDKRHQATVLANFPMAWRKRINAFGALEI